MKLATKKLATKNSTTKVRFGGRQMRLKPSPRAADVVVLGGEPIAQVTIYDSATILTRRDGPRWRQYPIRPEALAAALGNLPTSSGLLPPHTLGVGTARAQAFTVLYVPPRLTALKLESGGYTIPLPPLIWAGCGDDYRIWALDTLDYPTRGNTLLCRAPFPNVYPNGSICWGSSEGRPQAAPSTLLKVLKLFLEDSFFNLHLANSKSVRFPASVVGRWQQLAESSALEYPLDDLMPAERDLGWLLRGGAWEGGAQ